MVAPSAADGQTAWDEIVETYAGLVWAVPRRHQFTAREAANVSRLTWMRLSDRLGDLPPEAIGAWLERTAERECRRIIRLAGSVQEQAQPA